MTHLKKITIITAVLNAADLLEETIKSILPFLSEHVEYIIVDGGSEDGTVEVIKQYESHLKTWLSEPDKGVYDAMNKGWALADEHSRVLYLGAGDRIVALPDNLFGSLNDEAVIYGDVLLNDGKAFYGRADWRLKLYNSLHHQALLVPKMLSPIAPFDLTYPLYADFDFNQRLLKKDALFIYAPEFKTYASPAGLTGGLVEQEMQRVIKKNFGFFWAMMSSFGFFCARKSSYFERLHPVR